MTKETYIRITEPLRNNPKRAAVIHICNRILTGLVFVSYPALLLWLFRNQEQSLIRAILVPFDSFIILTIFRVFVNAKRPYEVFDIPPVIAKDTRGRSFPSRHVFSVFIIAMTFFAVCPVPVFGGIIFVLGILLAVVRVFAGVHFPRDVIAGAIFGIAAGYIGYFL